MSNRLRLITSLSYYAAFFILLYTFVGWVAGDPEFTQIESRVGFTVTAVFGGTIFLLLSEDLKWRRDFVDLLVGDD